MARVLSVDDYGTYGQVLLIVSFALAFLNFGLSEILYVYLSKEELDIKSTLSSNVLSLIILGLIGAFLLFTTSSLFAGFLDNPKLDQLISIYAWTLVFQLPYQSITAWLIYNGKIKSVTLLSIFSNLMKVLLVVIVIQLYKSVELVFYSILLTSVVQFCVAFYLTRENYTKNIRFNSSFQQIKDGLPLGLTALFGTGILYVDGIMVSNMLGVESYAIYRNGAIEVPFISTIYASIAAIILPEVTKLFGKNKLDDIVRLKRRVITNSMGLIYPILVFLLFNSKGFIVAYLGSKYEASAIVFLIFNLTLLLRVNSYSDVLISANKGNLILKVYLIAFTINILLNFILINEFDRIGAATSTVISIFLVAFFQLYYTIKLLSTDLFKLLNISVGVKVLIISIVVTFLVEIIDFKNMEVIEFFVKGIVYLLIVYSIILYKKYIERSILWKVLPIRIFNR